MQVDFVEGRILGSLIEKQLTTPQQYPLSLNALVLACNQTSNREPVTSLDEPTVEASLATLKGKGLVRYVLPSHGRSVVRYRQILDERLALDERQMALVGVLLLRGPQTIGELRGRTERMARFDSTEDVEHDLEGLTRGEEPFVARLARRPGQKEERWAHLLADEPRATAPTPRAAPSPSEFRAAPSAPATGGSDDLRADGLRDDGLRDEVESLRKEVEVLRAEVDGLKEALGL
ncbi:MAG TPA: YceH family protein [Acidimicrobiales bacterium]|nr:YceH family protein [Acidimicrobiales bacterium]